jgi:hypothetical protein
MCFSITVTSNIEYFSQSHSIGVFKWIQSISFEVVTDLFLYNIEEIRLVTENILLLFTLLGYITLYTNDVLHSNTVIYFSINHPALHVSVQRTVIRHYL